jgi:hypothetical protein
MVPGDQCSNGALYTCTGENTLLVLSDSNSACTEVPVCKNAFTSLWFVYLNVVGIDILRQAVAAVTHQNRCIHWNAVVTRQRQFDVVCGPGDVELNDARHRTIVSLQLDVADCHRFTIVRGVT